MSISSIKHLAKGAWNSVQFPICAQCGKCNLLRSKNMPIVYPKITANQTEEENSIHHNEYAPFQAPCNRRRPIKRDIKCKSCAWRPKILPWKALKLGDDNLKVRQQEISLDKKYINGIDLVGRPDNKRNRIASKPKISPWKSPKLWSLSRKINFNKKNTRNVLDLASKLENKSRYIASMPKNSPWWPSKLRCQPWDASFNSINFSDLAPKQEIQRKHFPKPKIMAWKPPKFEENHRSNISLDQEYTKKFIDLLPKPDNKRKRMTSMPKIRPWKQPNLKASVRPITPLLKPSKPIPNDLSFRNMALYKNFSRQNSFKRATKPISKTVERPRTRYKCFSESHEPVLSAKPNTEYNQNISFCETWRRFKERYH